MNMTYRERVPNGENLYVMSRTASTTMIQMKILITQFVPVFQVRLSYDGNGFVRFCF